MYVCARIQFAFRRNSHTGRINEDLHTRVKQIGHLPQADDLSSFTTNNYLSLFMRLLLILFIFTFIHFSCKITEQKVAGTYTPGSNSMKRLLLHKDRSFELIWPAPITIPDSAILPHPNFYWQGTWEITGRKKLVLHSKNKNAADQHSLVTDSITRFTHISSFHFWNRFGEPVPIRSIHLPPAKPKPHFGNGLYFFAQDFTATDTLGFYFDEYPAFTYPGNISLLIGNHRHKITLWEKAINMALPDSIFNWHQKKLAGISRTIIVSKKK
jgi:hypothetical protein